jgi:hypothetical protein
MSNIAAEGMFGELQPNGFVENNAEEFAKRAVELYKDPQLWKSKQELGFNLLNKRFNKIDFESNFSKKVDKLHKNLKTHRQTNFIGNLLQHQSLQSTKYMSKWIEEKNKN